MIAAILSAVGFRVDIDEDVDGAMTKLDGVDLLVVNAGDPWRDSAERLTPDAPGPAGLTRALGQGIGVLTLHCGLATLRDYPDWAPAVGAVWVPGSSWHPPLGPTRVTGRTLDAHLAVEDFDVADERYLSLQRIGHSRVVATHEGDQGQEPTAWVRTYKASRVAADVLGHDERSYDSPGHRNMIAQLARWASARV